jgi:hypothetical protein
MRIYGLGVVVTLLLFIASVLSFATVVFAPFILGALGLALAGAIGTADDRRVDQHTPQMHPTRWRDGA